MLELKRSRAVGGEAWANVHIHRSTHTKEGKSVELDLVLVQKNVFLSLFNRTE